MKGLLKSATFLIWTIILINISIVTLPIKGGGQSLSSFYNAFTIDIFIVPHYTLYLFIKLSHLILLLQFKINILSLIYWTLHTPFLISWITKKTISLPNPAAIPAKKQLQKHTKGLYVNSVIIKFR